MAIFFFFFTAYFGACSLTYKTKFTADDHNSTITVTISYLNTHFVMQTIVFILYFYIVYTRVYAGYAKLNIRRFYNAI